MTQSGAGRIHPTAIISPEAELGDDVVVGPYSIIEGAVRIGPGCVVGPQVHLIGPLTLGRENKICTGAVIGERPQHLRFNDAPSGVVIGNNNILREHVTIHGGTEQGHPTTLGDRNFLMVNSHVGHDGRIGNNCIFANGALVGGHCRIDDGVFLSGNAAIHQFCRVGRLALLSGCSTMTKDMPCFVMVQGYNSVVNLNVVGMRRAGIGNDEIQVLRQVFHILYRQGLPIRAALDRAEKEFGHVAPVAELVRFVRESERGISTMRSRIQAA
jgi:UDP-N-acetylglucosamine acyltransferase